VVLGERVGEGADWLSSLKGTIPVMTTAAMMYRAVEITSAPIMPIAGRAGVLGLLGRGGRGVEPDVGEKDYGGAPEHPPIPKGMNGS